MEAVGGVLGVKKKLEGLTDDKKGEMEGRSIVFIHPAKLLLGAGAVGGLIVAISQYVIGKYEFIAFGVILSVTNGVGLYYLKELDYLAPLDDYVEELGRNIDALKRGGKLIDHDADKLLRAINQIRDAKAGWERTYTRKTKKLQKQIDHLEAVAKQITQTKDNLQFVKDYGEQMRQNTQQVLQASSDVKQKTAEFLAGAKKFKEKTPEWSKLLADRLAAEQQLAASQKALRLTQTSFSAKIGAFKGQASKIQQECLPILERLGKLGEENRKMALNVGKLQSANGVFASQLLQLNQLVTKLEAFEQATDPAQQQRLARQIGDTMRATIGKSQQGRRHGRPTILSAAN